MTRVMVIGNAGGGKSRLSRRISAVHRFPYHAIDEIQWRPNWVPTPESDFTKSHEAILAAPRWLIDGYGSWPSVERRLKAADTIVLVDLPIRVHFWWAAKRQIGSLFFGLEDGPEGCPMPPVTFRLFAMMWRLHRESRPRLLAAVEERRSLARIIHLRSTRDLAEFSANPV